MSDKKIAFDTHDGTSVYFGDVYYWVAVGHGGILKVYGTTVVSFQDIKKGDKQFLNREDAEKHLNSII